ncbi:CAP-Gly domain-containing protein [Coniochaeta sp. PMI_546]|nr:CAP-Gly domain-containing protein [Coniochaeta sp. PMI_546]
MSDLEGLALGQTVRLTDGRTAIIRFLGRTNFQVGEWVGVELDDNSGKNDGSVNGERYFECGGIGRGMFCRPKAVTVIAQPPPPAPKPAAGPAAARKGGRPSSMFTSGNTTRAGATTDPALGKRMSLNAPSPSPVPRMSRPSSLVRVRNSPTKSPTKQLATASSSASNSRTATPSNARVASAGVKPPRPSVGAAGRPSMGPPSLPASRTTRQPSTSSAASRTSSAAARPPPARLSLAPGRVASRPNTLRNTSGGSASGTENGAPAAARDKSVTSPKKSDDDTLSPEILSPQPRSPVQAKTMALERLTSGPPAATTRSPAARNTATTSGSASATTSRAAAANNAAATREIEELQKKLRFLERKRTEDREKMAEMDKLQKDRDKFENIIQKLQAKLQPLSQENNELKKMLQEAEARLESVEKMQAEHESILELATIDKEIAQASHEAIKQEFDALKDKAEELELEVEILREENAELTSDVQPEERSSASWLGQEKKIQRLTDALLRLREITQQQEEEYKDQIKGLESDLREFETLKEDYAAIKEKLSQSEAAVEDLRQQLDTALGAEDMIEELTERNMSQAEQIEELKAVIEDLESLKEINDELEVNHVQNEKEMQEELDFRDSVIAEQARRAAQQEEALEDMEYTLSRFRELVTSLQTDLEDMRASHAVTETESEQLNSKSRAMMDLNMKLQISAAKAQVKAIDLELRRLEAQEAEQHLEIVKLFLPDTYKTDRDSVLALLRFKRLAFKANLLNGFIKERVNGQPHPGHEDDVFAGCDAVDKLTWVTSMCDRFVNSISHCSLEHFAKYEGALYELEPVERALNAWIDGLRRDELKEKQCASDLQRTMALMSHLGEVHIADDLESYADNVHMKATLMQSHLESAAVTFTTIKNMVQRVIPPTGDDDDLAQAFSRRAESVISQTRSAKVIAGKTVRALEDLKNRSLSLTPDTLEAFEQAETVSQEMADLARKLGVDLHQLLHEEGRTEPYTYTEVQTCAHKTAMAASGLSESDLFATYLNKLRTLTAQISDLAALSTDLTQTQEFERSQPPWLLRSQELRALKTIPVDAEEELRHLREEHNEARRAISVHEENLSVAQLKIATLESRMRDANAKASRISELEAGLERARAQTAGLKDDIEKQDRELKALEADRDRWKKVAGDNSSSRLLLEAGGGGGGEAGASGGIRAGQERAVATAREMEVLREEIAGLQAAVRYLREDNRRARLREQGGCDWLAEPLVRRRGEPAERRRDLVVAEGRDALGELVRLVSSARVFDLSTLPKDKLAWRPARSTPRYHAARQAEDYAAWKRWRDEVLRKSRAVVGGGGGGGGGGGERRKEVEGRKKGVRTAAARLQIRLPGDDGKVVPGTGEDVQIVGSREWEGLQGRLAAVM